MATFAITHLQRADNYLVVQTLEGTEIGTGQTVVVSGAEEISGGNGNGEQHHWGQLTDVNGTYVVQDVPTLLFLGVAEDGDFLFDRTEIITNQLIVYAPGDDFPRGPLIPQGVLTWTPQPSWIDADDVADWLGIAAATANDTAFLTLAAGAANQYAYRRRREAGYFDSLTVVPGNDVKLGTIMYAGTLYRERGSVDSFASFEDMGTPIPFGSNGQINRLLGVNRSQVA
jgi:hypothetical protein